MTATVWLNGDGYHVTYDVDGVDVDDAGPFYDEIEAVEAAVRADPDSIRYQHGKRAV